MQQDTKFVDHILTPAEVKKFNYLANWNISVLLFCDSVRTVKFIKATKKAFWKGNIRINDKALADCAWLCLKARFFW